MSRNSALFGLIMLALIVGTVQGVTIEPGEIYTGNCTQDCVNGTYNVTASLCPENESCGVCEVSKVLSWNQTYKNDDGPCGLDIQCEDFNWSRMGMVSFPVEIKIMKDDNGTIDFTITYFDRNGEVLKREEDHLKSKSIIEQTLKHEFTCPAELTTDVNMVTCAPYLTKILNSSDPMMLQMATGTTICTKELVDCMSLNQAQMEQASAWKNRFVQCDEQRSEMDNQIFQLKFDLNEPEGESNQKILKTMQEWGSQASMWSAAFFILLFVFGLWFFISWWQGNRFQGGVQA